MTAPRRLTRAESKSETRSQLLRSAARLFVRKGFVATSLADIAEETGVTKGAVYSNFSSKEELFLALLSEPVASAQAFAPSVREPLTERGGAAGRAFGAYSNSVRPSAAHVALFLEVNAVMLRSEHAREVVAARTRAFAIELGASLAEAFEAPDVDHMQLGLMAQSLYAGLMVHGAFLDEIDEHTFVAAYEMLAAAARLAPAARRRRRA